MYAEEGLAEADEEDEARSAGEIWELHIANLGASTDGSRVPLYQPLGFLQAKERAPLVDG